MKIVSNDRKQIVSINSTKANAAIKSLRVGSKKMTTAEKKLNMFIRRYLKVVEEQMNMTAKNLFLNDVEMAEKVGCSPRQAKTIKQKLTKAGLLVLMKRQTGEGTYPLWFFNFEYVEWSDVEVKTRNRKSKSEMYEQQLLDIYAEIELEVLDFFKDVEESEKWWAEEKDEEFEEITITKGMYYGMIEKAVSGVLSEMGLTRADFKLPN